MRARLLLRDKTTLRGHVVERVVWQLPSPSEERPHGLKYRLHCGRAGACVVRYDNEAGKGDHVHYGTEERPYAFLSLTQLLLDFDADVKRLVR